MLDLLVAGGGPSGLATAVRAAGAGLSVAVVEPRRGILDKACGEGLMPATVASLREIGVDVAGRPFAGIRYVGSGRVAEGRFRAGPGLGVRRTTLHAALAERARALGVHRVEGRVQTLRQDTAWVEAAGLQARWLVAADGLHSPVRRLLGLDRPPRRAPRWGLRQHYAVAPWTDLVEVHWSADAEAYVTPVADDLVGVAVLFSRRGVPFDARIAAFPALAARLEGAPAATPLRGAGPFEQRVRCRRAGRVLLVGDAAGYVDALTGEGLNLGLAAAREVVRCLVAGTPERYDAAWRGLTRRHRALTGGLLWASSHPPVRRRIVPAAARLPRVYAAILDALA